MPEVLAHARTASPVAPELAGTVAESLVLAVAPTTGRFRPAVDLGAVIEGATVGVVTGGRGRSDEVTAPLDGTVHRLLARPGQLVRRGQPLAWIQRETTSRG